MYDVVCFYTARIFVSYGHVKPCQNTPGLVVVVRCAAVAVTTRTKDVVYGGGGGNRTYTDRGKYIMTSSTNTYT